MLPGGDKNRPQTQTSAAVWQTSSSPVWVAGVLGSHDIITQHNIEAWKYTQFWNLFLNSGVRLFPPPVCMFLLCEMFDWDDWCDHHCDSDAFGHYVFLSWINQVSWIKKLSCRLLTVMLANWLPFALSLSTMSCSCWGFFFFGFIVKRKKNKLNLFYSILHVAAAPSKSPDRSIKQTNAPIKWFKPLGCLQSHRLEMH